MQEWTGDMKQILLDRHHAKYRMDRSKLWPQTHNDAFGSARSKSQSVSVFIIYSSLNDAVSSSDYLASNDCVISELERIWNETMILSQRETSAFAWRDWGKPWKTSVRMTSLQAKIWTTQCVKQGAFIYQIKTVSATYVVNVKILHCDM
jgi:hypothetical protein